MKTCRGCHETKPLADYHRDAESADGCRPRCKACVKQRDDLRRDERNRRARERYYEDPATKIEKTRAYHLANPEWSRERLRASHVAHAEQRAVAAKLRGLDPAVAQSRKDASRRSESRRRARVSSDSADHLSAQDLRDLVEAYDGRCYCCNRAFTDVLPMTIDHWQPLARGGSHRLLNLRPACMPCNSRKNARWPVSDTVLAEIRHAVLSAAEAANGEGVMPCP